MPGFLCFLNLLWRFTRALQPPLELKEFFSIAGHLIGTRATTMKDENFEKKLFCNVNRETMLSGRKRKSMDV